MKPRQPTQSTFGEYHIKGTPEQIAGKYYGLAMSASLYLREGLLQQAEHWYRVATRGTA
jgi:hypothetical protein